jgi:HlyD family secretion protein
MTLQVQAQLEGAKAQVTSSQEQAQQALWQINVVDNQLRASQLNVLQAQQDARGRIYQAQSNVATAEAQLQQSLAQLKLARVDRDRYAQLVKEGAVTRQQFDQAQTTFAKYLSKK